MKSMFQSSGDAVVVSPLATELGYSKERPLVMGMNTSYAPLQYVNDQGAPSGYDIEFTKILMRRMGIPFTFSPNHWDKMSPGIIEGKYDMGMLVYSPYRKELTNYSNAVFRMYYQIVYRKKDYKEFDFRHLEGKTIAYMKSRPIGLMLKDSKAKDIPITDLSEAIEELTKGKYDGVICYRFQANYYVELLHLEGELSADELSLEPREYCYASYNPKLIEAINAELRFMEEEGIIDDVYTQAIVSQFDTIRIPAWVWFLLIFLTFLFLVIFSINRYLLSKRLQIANARAEESTRMKSDFIKQISHEIRTPLNILSGFTQILTSPQAKLTEEEKANASLQIMQSTDRITGLVNKMLELSDVNSQTVLERNDNITPLYIAEYAIMETGIAEMLHISFQLKKGEGAEQSFNTNMRSVVRILELQLDNAIKFTQPAEGHLKQAENHQKENVTLTVEATEDKVIFLIENTGITIPAKDAEHIFDEFVQLDEYYNGTGIGLTVARSLARRLGGDIVLDTTYKEGARFVTTLKR
jgi:signal transduction histidine kinase